MTSAGRSGTTAAAVLPAALAGALLVAAPFAGTTTAPLAKSTPRAAVSATHPSATHSSSAGSLSIDISPASVAILSAAELVLLSVGGAVIVAARRSRVAEEH